MKKNGFIATSIMYSFFAVFSMVALIILATYTHYRVLINNINNNVLTELNAKISDKYTTIYNLLNNGDFEEDSAWTYVNTTRIEKNVPYGSSYSGTYSARMPKTDASFNQSFLIKDKVDVDNKYHKVYVAFRVFRNGPVTGTGTITLNASGKDYAINGSSLIGGFSNWTLYSEIVDVGMTNDNDWTLNFNITGNTKDNYTFIDNAMVVDIKNVYNGNTTPDNDMKSYLDTYLDYFNGSYVMTKYGNGASTKEEDIPKTYTDASGASSPELYQGMIPINISDTGVLTVADTTKEWYNYGQREWANAVLVNCADSSIKSKYFDANMNLLSSAVGKTIDMSEVLQMYVWIPRYKYLLWNANNGSSNPQAISITFESKETAKSNGSTNGTYLTHPAFTFGSTELNGIWVGKFETSGTTTNIQIKPNQQSLTAISVGNMFNATRNIENNYASNYGINANELDTHMMKNMEWGAVAYLASSIYGRYTSSSTCIPSGCETWINNVNTYTHGSYSPSITGCSGSSVSADVVNSISACVNGYDWSTLGKNASVNGNITGIYDMSGGNTEYVMGNMVDSSGNFYPSSSGLTKPDGKYFDSYAYFASSSTDHARGKLGDATKETLKTFGNSSGGWYGDYTSLPSSTTSWFHRGGLYSYSTGAGLFNFSSGVGAASMDVTFRSIITSQ